MHSDLLRLRNGAFALAVLAHGCTLKNPAVDRLIAAQGPEAPGVPVGELHRPNQPCVLCHSQVGKDVGAAETIYSVAGTVYREPQGDANGIDSTQRPRVLWPIDVYLVDSTGATHVSKTNCAGNFYVNPGDFTPVYPLWVTLKIDIGGMPFTVDMESPVHGDGSCASCHADPANEASAGHVFFNDDPAFDASLPMGRPCSQEASAR